MYDPRGLNHFHCFQLNWLRTQVVEQPDTIAEQDWGHGYVYFVKQSGLEALLRDTRRGYGHVLVACGCFRLLDGALNAISDEREW